MSSAKPVLHLLYGLPAAGKSTLAHELAQGPGIVLIDQDAWLSELFGDEMTDLPDFLRFSARLRAAMGPHVVALLRAGVSVVLDFPANTPRSRSWMRGLIVASGADHVLHVLDPGDDTCRARLKSRNDAGEHPFATSPAQFDEVARHVSPPDPAEGFTLRHHPARG